MNIFLFGSNGMLGTDICSYLSKTYNVIGITQSDYDLSNVQITTLRELLINKNLEKGDILIKFAGVIPQASKQRDLYKNLYYRINSIIPVMLSMICE
jgi:dTDP-4-dehydrorhamnose reductase